MVGVVVLIALARAVLVVICSLKCVEAIHFPQRVWARNVQALVWFMPPGCRF